MSRTTPALIVQRNVVSPSLTNAVYVNAKTFMLTSLTAQEHVTVELQTTHAVFVLEVHPGDL